MTTITFLDNIKLSQNTYLNFYEFMEDFVENNYSDSNVYNKFDTALDMSNIGLPDTFIKNKLKSM